MQDGKLRQSGIIGACDERVRVNLENEKLRQHGTNDVLLVENWLQKRYKLVRDCLKHA
ncbi:MULTISPECIES: hypothetical protein [Vibrio]|uniref:Uncharacterized protein n=1 Tax=Vibrio navarrensis TaxID=29495 RepID=A0AAJ4LW15_9VIBR|nr:MULTISPECIES: hypothetical protein [Vibrio]QPL55446.1 hypothetical protein I3X05_20945 [Vibrio navarrensis]